MQYVKQILLAAALIGTLFGTAVANAWTGSSVSLGSVPSGHTGYVYLSISSSSSFDGFSFDLENLTTGYVAYFGAYLGSYSYDDNYFQGTDGYLSGDYGSWSWYVEGLPAGSYQLDYHASDPNQPIGTDLSSSFSIGGSVAY